MRRGAGGLLLAGLLLAAALAAPAGAVAALDDGAASDRAAADDDDPFPWQRFLQSLERAPAEARAFAAVKEMAEELRGATLRHGRRMVGPLLDPPTLERALARARLLAQLDRSPGLRSDHVTRALQLQPRLNSSAVRRVAHYLEASAVQGLEHHVDRLLDGLGERAAVAVMAGAVRAAEAELREAMRRIEVKRAQVEAAMAAELDRAQRAARAAEAAAGFRVRQPEGGGGEGKEWLRALASLVANHQARGGAEDASEAVPRATGEAPPDCMDESVAADQYATCCEGGGWNLGTRGPICESARKLLLERAFAKEREL